MSKGPLDNRPRARVKVRKFHQARWEEPIVCELHEPGERGILVPGLDQAMSDCLTGVLVDLPTGMRRESALGLPEIAQLRVQRHYLRLSQQTLGA